MLRWQAKAICGLIMAVAMPICFLLPVKLSNVFSRWGSKGQYVLDLLTCFAGGVFLASYLVFMAPAVRVLIEENLMKENNIEYPLPDMIIGLGFFMMLLLDKLVKVISTRNMVNDVIIDRDNNVDQKLDNGNVSSAEIKQNPNSLSTLLGRHSGYISNDEEKDLEAFSRHRHESADIEGIGATLSPNHMSIIHRDSIDVEGIGATLSPNHMSRLSSRRSRIDSESSAYPQPPLHSRQQSIAEAAVDSTRSVSRSMVMMLALSIDSVLEGMTIGLKKTVLEVWVIFIGIIIHESVIAFCLGLQLVRVHTSIRPVVLASIIYTIMNPLGVLVATLIYETAEADKRIELANGILQALTAGCFIYIVFYEILEGQIDQDTPISKILATLVGYLFLASFAAVPGSSSYAHTTTTTISRSSFDTNIYNATSSYNNNITALYNNISATLTTTIA